MVYIWQACSLVQKNTTSTDLRSDIANRTLSSRMLNEWRIRNKTICNAGVIESDVQLSVFE